MATQRARAKARFTIAIAGGADAVIVTVHGVLDLVSAGYLESVLTDLAKSQDVVSLIVDLHDAREGDTGGLSVFASVAASAARTGGKLVLRNAAAEMCPALEAAGLTYLMSDERAHRAPPTAHANQPGHTNHPGHATQYGWGHPAGSAWLHRTEDPPA